MSKANKQSTRELNDDELHFIGIKAVYTHLIDNGYEVIAVRKELEVNPQILAKKDGEFQLVVVKTRRFPEMGILFPHVASQVIYLAKQRGGKALFASVGVANGSGLTDEEMSKPMKNGEYYINFNGLLPIVEE